MDGGAAISAAVSSGSITFLNYEPGQTIIQGSTISLTAVASSSSGEDISQNIVWKDSSGSTLESGPTINYLADTVGVLVLQAEVNDGGEIYRKSAYYNVEAASLKFTSGNSIIRGQPGSEVIVAWDWTGEVNEIAELEAISLVKSQVESSEQTRYLLPDSRTPVDIPITVNNVGVIENMLVGLRINHTWPADLTISIVHPDGTEIVLAKNNGNGDHRNGSEVWGEGSRSCNGDLAYFSDNAPNSISERSKPFTGFSIPIEELSLLSGKSAAGEWIIRIVDDWQEDEGELFCAQILLSTSQPEQTVLISSQTALANLSATWLLPDPPSYAGVFEFKFPATSLGTELGGCCALLGLPTPPSNVTISRTGSAMTVTWDPGAQSTQTAPITGYVADAYRPTGTQINAGTCTSISTTCTIQA